MSRVKVKPSALWPWSLVVIGIFILNAACVCVELSGFRFPHWLGLLSSIAFWYSVGRRGHKQAVARYLNRSVKAC